MGKSMKGPAPKTSQPISNLKPKSAAARRKAMPPTGKGSSVQSAKPVSSRKPPAPTTGSIFRNGGTSGSPTAQGFTVIPRADRPAAKSPGPKPIPDYGGNPAQTAAGPVGLDPQMANPNPNSLSQSEQHGNS